MSFYFNFLKDEFIDVLLANPVDQDFLISEIR